MTLVQLFSPFMVALAVGAAAAVHLVRNATLTPQARPVRVRANDRRD
ncbi:hypothetical protein [Novacetimonas pomaceti]|nr:hypothetical protein [Novacetimonas pomaceti]MBV1835435.1 hypothetical protein [Novacetimonas pomaceti]